MCTYVYGLDVDFTSAAYKQNVYIVTARRMGVCVLE